MVGEAEYCVDMVMCIDMTTGEYGFIKDFKENAIRFYDLLMDAMEDSGHLIDQLRIRIIGFRDFIIGAEPIVDSGKFFLLPDEIEEFESFVRGLQIVTGDFSPKTGLEAIAMALKSDWTQKGTKQKHVIFVYTNSASYKLREMADNSHYPEGMPTDLAELGRWWNEGVPNGSYKPRSGRLVITAPNAYPWTGMSEWDRCWFSVQHVPVICSFIEESLESIIDLLMCTDL